MRFFLLAGVLLALLAAACGQRGPLYLRDNPPPGIKPEKSERAKPAPYPRDPRDAAEPK